MRTVSIKKRFSKTCVLTEKSLKCVYTPFMSDLNINEMPLIWTKLYFILQKAKKKNLKKKKKYQVHVRLENQERNALLINKHNSVMLK